MSARISNIAKNTSYFTLALVLQKIISFSYFTVLARNLIPADLGKYYFAISFTTIFAVFIDFGLANVLVREVAKRKEEAGRIVGTVLAVKIPLATVSLVMVVGLVNLLGYGELTRRLVYLSSVCMVLDSFTLVFFSCIRGFHKLVYESIASVVFQVIVVVFGLIALHLRLGLQWLLCALVAASIFNIIYSSALLRFKWKINIRPVIDRTFIRSVVLLAIPFGLYAVLQRAYLYLDTVLLSILAGDRYVGLYQIAFKIIFALQFLPLAFMASLYPAFAAYWKSDRKQLAVSFERAMNYLIIISVPISIGVIVLADVIIRLFKPEYSDAVVPLRLIMAGLPFLFMNFPVGSLLNACDRQKINTVNIGITLSVSVILNIFLIPFFRDIYGNGAIGASLTVTVTNVLMFMLGMRIVPRVTRLPLGKIFKIFSKVIVSALLMSFLALYLGSRMNIIVVITFSGALYFMTLFCLGGFRKEDVISVWQSFVNKSA